MQLRSENLLVRLLALLGYVLSLVAIPGVGVMCYGSDGRVVFEPSGCGTVCAPESDVASLGAIGSLAVVDSSSCVDVSISVKEDWTRTQRAGDDRGASVKALASPLVFCSIFAVDLPLRLSTWTSSPPCGSYPPSLRSIILLV